LVAERPQRRDVVLVLHLRDEHAVRRPVERRCERIDVCRDRRRACAVERIDDVDALSRAREEDGRHGGQYTRNGSAARAEAANTAATTGRARRGRRSSAYPNASAQAGAAPTPYPPPPTSPPPPRYPPLTT